MIMRLFVLFILVELVAGNSVVVPNKHHRSLQSQVFKPLDCNTRVDLQDQTCTTPWSTYVGTSLEYSQEIVIECGDCVVFDNTVEEDLKIVLAGGLDIQGKLVFPDESKVTIEAPFVRLQGYLEMTSSKPVDGQENIKLIFTNDDVVASSTFVPADSNAFLGPQLHQDRSIVVAGGQVKLHGLAFNTPSWVPVEDVLQVSTGPELDPSQYPSFRQLPATCDNAADGVFVNETFKTPTSIADSHVFATLGANIEYATNDESKKVLLVKNRTNPRHGLELDLGDFRSCLVPNYTYLFTARVRLHKTNQSAGSPTDCASSGTNCLVVQSEYMAANRTISQRSVYTETQSYQTKYGEWWIVSAEIQFTGLDLLQSNIYQILRLEGPGTGVDLEMDNVVFRAPPASAFRMPPGVCQDLVPGNNGAEDVGDSAFPFDVNFEQVHLGVQSEESNNKYFAVTGRKYAYYHDEYEQDFHWTSVAFDFPVGCVENPTTYKFHMKLRVHPNEESPNPGPVNVILKGHHNAAKSRTYKTVMTCPQSVGEWVVCESEFNFTGAMASLEPYRYQVYFITKGAPTVDYDVDDISFKLISGGESTATKVIVSDTIKDKWQVGSQVLLTSTDSSRDEEKQVRTITSVTDHSDAGFVIVGVTEINGQAPPTDATDFTLLSRNIVMEGTKLTPDSMEGAHLLIKDTPQVQQMLEGVEFRNFGQQGEMERYPINIHNGGNLSGSRIANNVIRESNLYCIALHETQNVQVVDNVAYDTVGQCFASDNQGGNVFFGNLEFLTHAVSPPPNPPTPPPTLPPTPWPTILHTPPPTSEPPPAPAATPTSSPTPPPTSAPTAPPTSSSTPPPTMQPTILQTPPTPRSECAELVFNGDLKSGSIEPWDDIFLGDYPYLVEGYEGPGDFALELYDGFPFQYIRSDCLEAGKVYEAKAKIIKIDENEEEVACGDYCPELVLQTTVGAQQESKVISTVSGSAGLGWEAMYGTFEATDFDATAGSQLRIAFENVEDYTYIVIDDVSIGEKPSPASPPPSPSPTAKPTMPPVSEPTPKPTMPPSPAPTMLSASPTPVPTVPSAAPTPSSTTPPGDKNVCPGVGQSDSIADPSYPFVASNDLCTLTKVTTDVLGEVTAVVPVARSYGSHDWEMAAGQYAARYLESFDCNDGLCRVTLPPLASDESFVLSSYAYSVDSVEDERARFLEMTTFGTRKSDLDSWSFSNYASWVQNQVALPATSHREYWRERSNPRWVFSQPVARSDHPCNSGSRWRKFSLNRKDYKKTNDSPLSGTIYVKNTTYTIDSSGQAIPAGPYVLFMDGHARTVVADLKWQTKAINARFPVWDPNHGYALCGMPKEYTGGKILMRTKPYSGFPKGACREISRAVGNPIVDMTGFDSYAAHVFYLSSADELRTIDNWKDLGKKRNDDMYYLKHGLTDELCESLPEQADDFDAPVFAQHPALGWLQWDSRLSLQRNTPESPIADGGGSANIATAGQTVCSNAARSFLNADKCVLSTDDSACGSAHAVDITIDLNGTNILKLHELTNRYLYGIKGLTVSQPEYGEEVNHPCTRGTRSRWEKDPDTSCSNPTNLRTQTRNTLTDLIAKSKDSNAFIRDVVFTTGLTCDSRDEDVEIKIQVGNDCWTHVHPDEWSVFDVTYWTLDHTHPGNKYAATLNRPHPIKKFLDNGRHFLEYPSFHPTDSGFNHPLTRWDTHHLKFDYVGRFGDSVDYRDLPNELRLDQVADHFGTAVTPEGNFVVVCGSPGEVANDASKGSSFELTSHRRRDTVSLLDLARQREIVWTMASLYSKDQLRQRMAWALSQILAIAKTAISVHERNTEPFLYYYDIFVRNAFGNYLDVLREISYSPIMAENLSFLASKSSAYVRERFNRIEFADENFAREIMQLFSTGLILLNLDGTPKLDANNSTQPVYNNADIRSVSRVWTGFDYQEYRGNIEAFDGKNRIDPMAINPTWRDRFPKSDLHGGFIGDRYPLCVDLPERQFLRKGSKYRLLGSSAVPLQVTDDSRFTQRFVLDKAGSSLYSVLCSKKGGRCEYPVEVTLDANLPCDKLECEVDTVRVVKVDEGIFYEYVEPACVEHPFFDNAMKVNRKKSDQPAVCANPLLPAASSACCEPPDQYTLAVSNNLYEIERMKFDTQDERCRNIGRQSCEYDIIDRNADSHLNNVVYRWAVTPCTIQVKVNPSGEAAIVHNMPVSGDKALHVDDGTTNYFQVGWKSDLYPQQTNGNCGVCSTIEGNNCLCETTVTETAFFNKDPENAKSILDSLYVGAPDPSSYNFGTYTSTRIKDFTVHRRGSGYEGDTIFEVKDEFSRTYFLKNSVSTVNVEGGYSFRNPVHFMSLVPSEANVRNAVYETDALLEHLFYHDNTAPFLCVRFIQRFGISNPSPRYVKECSKAFRNGYYLSEERIRFGSDKYGDLAATVAAIVLDREARSVVLDVDPAQGSIREPLVRVISLMRSLNFQPKTGVKGASPMVIFNNMNEHIGQMAHEAETVFSFFLSEFKPDGPVSTGALVAPEAQMLDMPKVIDLINGIHSMIKYGLSSCDYGFGFNLEGSGSKSCADDGRYVPATGKLNYAPSGSSTEDVVNELCTLLTSGRLDYMSRQKVMVAYDDAMAQSGPAAALRVAQQLITTTPEFHTTNTVKFSGKKLPDITSPIPAPGVPYKAVVMLMFAGGCDSFNLLVPKTCSNNGGGDAYTRYANARSPAHLTKESLLPIDGSGQVGCSQFGLHEDLPIVQRLYNDKDLLFFANTGVLGKPSTKKTFTGGTPTQLFAHNSMQRETKRVDVFDEAAGTGVLGRLSDALSMSGLSVGSIGIDSTSIALVGEPGASPPPSSISKGDIKRFMPKNSATMTKANMIRNMEDFNNATKADSGFMASTWSTSLLQSLDQNEALYNTLQSTGVSQNFGNSEVGQKLATVAKLIKTRQSRGKNADVFYVEYGSWDHHQGLENGLSSMFVNVNTALTAFAAEMKAQSMWDSTTVVQTSEFARTLTPNSGGGTDHAWGGNYFMFGGSVKGGRILGQYPQDMSPNSSLNLGRGRLLPTRSWDQIWPGVSQWAGVSNNELLDMICPNHVNFPFKYSDNDLFE